MRTRLVLLCMCMAALFAAGGAGAEGGARGILISDTHGFLHFYDFDTGAVSQVYGFPYGQNFDIQYANHGRSELVIANLDGRLDHLDLRSGQLTTLFEGAPLCGAIGVAVGGHGIYYVADPCGAIYTYDSGSDTLTLLANQGPNGEPFQNPDGILVDKEGRVVFGDHGGRLYRIEPSTGAVELLAMVPGASLNGMALERRGDLIVVAHDSAGPGSAGAIYRVDPETGAATPLHVGLPLRDPEDVVLDQHGNAYIIDSDFQNAFGPHNAGLFVLRPDGTLEQLAQNLPGDLTDILLFRGRPTPPPPPATYTDPNAFQAAIAGLGEATTVDFNELDASPCSNSTAGRAPFAGETYVDITFSNPNGYPLYIAPGSPCTFGWNASNSLSVGEFPFECCDGNDDDLAVTFASPSSAVGFTLVDNGSRGPDEFVEFFDGDGAVVAQVPLPADYSPFRAFVGIVSEDRPIASVSVVERAGDSDDVNYDDFVFVPARGGGP